MSRHTTFHELLTAKESPLDIYPPDACHCLYGYLDEDGLEKCPACNGTWKLRPEPTCSRCGRPLTDPERQADGMGLCCRSKEPHRRRIRVLTTEEDGTKIFRLYSLTNAGTAICYEVRINMETGEISCTCPDHKYRGSTCKHIRRAMVYEARRQKEKAVR